METGTGNTEVVQQQAQEPAANSGMSDVLQGLVSPDTLAKLKEAETKIPVAQQPATPTAEEQEAAANNAIIGTEKPADATAQAAEAKDPTITEGEDKKSAFGLKNGKQDKKPGTEVAIETPEHLFEAVKSTFGQEVKEMKDMTKVLESAKKWRADSQKLEETSREATGLREILENLPEHMVESIQKYYKGEDYMAPFKSLPKFDYKETAEKQDIKELVNHYFPGEFTEEDFAEETPHKSLQIAITASKDKYTVEKSSLETKRADEMLKADNRLAAIKTSVTSSVNHLKQTFPDTLEENVKDIQSILEGGQQAVLGLIFNQDGTVKPEAAEGLMFLKHGKSEIEYMMQAAGHIAETKVAEDLLSRTADGPKPKTGKGVEQMSDKAKKLINEFSTFKNKTTF